MIKIKVLGIDSSTKSTGYAIIEDDVIIKSGVIKPDAKMETIDRIIFTEREIMKIFNKYKPEIVCIEEVATVRNAVVMRALVALVYHLYIEFRKQDELVVLVRPSAWRSECSIKGKGRDELKKNTMEYVKKVYNKNVGEDEADALCIARYGLSLEVEE